MSRSRWANGGEVLRQLVAVGTPLLGLLWLLTGCVSPGGPRGGTGEEIDAVRVKTRDDITEIVQYWSKVPWLFDSDGRPVGFKAMVYFVSGQTGLGTFVPGKILVWMYLLEPGPDGLPQRRLVRGWEFDEQESVLYRVRRKFVQGYAYGFPLMWAPEVAPEDVIGRRIEVVFGYQRLDGRMLLAPGHREKVPVPPGYRLPARSVSPGKAPKGSARDDRGRRPNLQDTRR